MTRPKPISKLIFGLGAGALALSSIPAADAAAQGPPTIPLCAWGLQVKADTINVFYPDSAAAYWVLPFTVQDGLRITLSGRYPDSRYASFNVYKQGGGSFTVNGVGSSLPDYRIQPDAGSTNPWQQASPAGGGYTVTLRSDVTQGQPNTLPLAPAGTAEGSTGQLVLRTYLPAGGDFSKVPLPAVTFERDGVSRTVPGCRKPSAAQPMVSTTTGTTGTAGGPGVQKTAVTSESIAFARPASVSGIFPNADSAYLFATVPPPIAGKVMVVQGKAPKSATGSHPSVWPSAGTDMRYWSMCTNLTYPVRPVVVNRLPGGAIDYGCRSDDQTSLDSEGRYTYVIGTETQRAAIEKIPAVTFLPYSNVQLLAKHTVLLRNMVVDPDFTQAVQNVPADGDPASAAKVMGPYYPTAKACALAGLIARGPRSCGTNGADHAS